MPRIISETQKKELFKAFPSQFTINKTTVSASKIWSNQIVTSYPTITLNVSQDGIPEISDVVDGVLYYKATLTVHVLAKTMQGIAGAILAEAMCNEIVEEVANWTEPLTGDVRIFDRDEDIKSVQSLGQENGVFDYAFSIRIYHS